MTIKKGRFASPSIHFVPFHKQSTIIETNNKVTNTENTIYPVKIFFLKSELI